MAVFSRSVIADGFRDMTFMHNRRCVAAHRLPVTAHALISRRVAAAMILSTPEFRVRRGSISILMRLGDEMSSTSTSSCTAWPSAFATV